MSDPTTADTGGGMRARRWAIAACYRRSEAYDVPTLPAWTVHREDGRLALGDEGRVFISAGNPVEVWR
ncbi:hypothetical protein [Halosegnis sp.]|uniref:hypothetical protein n=1 Tax=Halosegnis sp. TaxID=2864959 RepID=UPI0035D4E734